MIVLEGQYIEMMKEYTPIPVKKWTVSSIIKLMDREYSKTLKQILDSENLTRQEKNVKIDIIIKMLQEFYNGILINGLTIKK